MNPPCWLNGRSLAELAGTASSLLPVVALGLTLVWMGSAHTGRGLASPAWQEPYMPVEDLGPRQETQGGGRLLIVVFPASRAKPIGELLHAEAALRELLGEAPRRAAVIGVEDALAADQIADSARQDFGQFESLQAVVVARNDSEHAEE